VYNLGSVVIHNVVVIISSIVIVAVTVEILEWEKEIREKGSIRK